MASRDKRVTYPWKIRYFVTRAGAEFAEWEGSGLCERKAVVAFNKLCKRYPDDHLLLCKEDVLRERKGRRRAETT